MGKHFSDAFVFVSPNGGFFCLMCVKERVRVRDGTKKIAKILRCYVWCRTWKTELRAEISSDDKRKEPFCRLQRAIFDLISQHSPTFVAKL